MPSTTDTVPPTAPTNLSGDTLDNEIHMNWGLSTDNADPQSQILYEFYLNGVANRGDVLFGSSGLVYCRGVRLDHGCGQGGGLVRQPLGAEQRDHRPMSLGAL